MRVAFQSLLVTVALFIVTACGNSDGQAANASPGSAGRGGGGRGGRGPEEIPVEIAIAARGPITRSTTLTGNVEPIRRIGINSQLGGAILAINVEEGNAVRKDQVLAQIDAREVEVQLLSANAALTAAQSAMERAEKMRAARIYTDVEYERDRTALASALSQRDQLQTRLGYASVKAPIDGIIVEKRVEAGDVVGTQTRLLAVADISTLVVRVNVSELEVGGLREGQRVEIAIDALRSQTVGGRIRRIFPGADSVSRLVPVEVELTGTGVREVKPGFLVRTTFHSNARENALLVPAAAVVISAGSAAVYLVKDGVARRTNVRTGLAHEGQMEIVDGVSAGDSVIVAGNTSVRDGGKVRVVTAASGDSVTPTLVPGRGRSAGGRGP